MKITYVHFLLLLTLVLAANAKPLKPAKIIKAVNCGLKEGFTRGEGDFKY